MAETNFPDVNPPPSFPANAAELSQLRAFGWRLEKCLNQVFGPVSYHAGGGPHH